jgi:hypothetical protein
LNYIRDVVVGVKSPNKIHFDEQNGRLYVLGNEGNYDNCYVKVFAVWLCWSVLHYTVSLLAVPTFIIMFTWRLTVKWVYCFDLPLREWELHFGSILHCDKFVANLSWFVEIKVVAIIWMWMSSGMTKWTFQVPADFMWT